MNPQRIFGVILLSVGILVLALGLRAEGSALTANGTGIHVEKSLWYLVGGSAMTFVGVALACLGGRTRLRNL